MNVETAFGILSSRFQLHLSRSRRSICTNCLLFAKSTCKRNRHKNNNFEIMDVISHIAPNASSNVAIDIRNEIADYS